MDLPLYQALTTWMTLPEFLDLEEATIVKRDRAMAWEAHLRKHPHLQDT